MARLKAVKSTEPVTNSESRETLAQPRRLTAMQPKRRNFDANCGVAEEKRTGSGNNSANGSNLDHESDSGHSNSEHPTDDSEDDYDSSVVSLEPDQNYEDISEYDWRHKARYVIAKGYPHGHDYQARLSLVEALHIAPSAVDVDGPGPMHLTHLLLSPKYWPQLTTQQERFEALSVCLGEARTKKLLQTGKKNTRGCNDMPEDRYFPSSLLPELQWLRMLCGEENVFLVHRDWFENEEEFKARQNRRKERRKARLAQQQRSKERRKLHWKMIACLRRFEMGNSWKLGRSPREARKAAVHNTERIKRETFDGEDIELHRELLAFTRDTKLERNELLRATRLGMKKDYRLGEMSKAPGSNVRNRNDMPAARDACTCSLSVQSSAMALAVAILQSRIYIRSSTLVEDVWLVCRAETSKIQVAQCPTQLVPKAKDALLFLNTLLELLESYHKSQYLAEILSRLQVDWRSLWSWLSVFIRSYANLKMGTNFEDNNDSDDLELRAIALTKLFGILFHILNLVNIYELPSSRKDVYSHRFKSLLHGSRGFYALLVDAIAFGSVNASNVYFGVMDVLYELLSGEPEDAATDCFVAAISTSPYSKQMPRFFLSPCWSNLASRLLPQTFAGSFFRPLLFVFGSWLSYLSGSVLVKIPCFTGSRAAPAVVENSILEQRSKDVRSAEYFSQHSGLHPKEYIMTFSNALGHLIEVLGAYMRRIDRCTFLLQAGVTCCRHNTSLMAHVSNPS
ncbi:hypothetical protein K435DRAFT_793121 [Dendrothele bispora CBS 962.96]|uniref:Uncharacterized protein n=1 Tax=Dendrothele bispora (strain CBS 962.96) TaxID=1314807 RepID=A0A4S8MHA0_DENBC|nr:hypothetical protein K435DRAFT_793121 [Dendrothele bispora CBS 962.96]